MENHRSCARDEVYRGRWLYTTVPTMRGGAYFSSHRTDGPWTLMATRCW